MNARSKDSVTAQIRFRKMLTTDLPVVMYIERDSYPFPWSVGIFRDCVRVGYFCQVVEWRGVVYGYGVMSFAADEAHILNICLHRSLREQGMGRALLQHLLGHARQSGMQQAFLEVRPSNVAAIHLYQSMGFNRVGVRTGYYQASPGREDAWVYKLALQGVDVRC